MAGCNARSGSLQKRPKKRNISMNDKEVLTEAEERRCRQSSLLSRSKRLRKPS
jgi:hypothetical protein